eukprot:GGOE01001629.1.p1 GENE.GGOE01001629.1~~GGOE01001629.1.p1  ORF type:complete len:449 (-),score=94.06 GGOE01001629.1:108-1454(-)
MAIGATFNTNCEVSTSQSKGRHLRCVQPLSSGSVVITESPFAHVVDPRYATEICQTCLRTSSQLEMCRGCHLVGYCGDVCCNADRLAHSKECRSIQQVRPHVPTPTIRLVLRLLRQLEVEEWQERRLTEGLSALLRFEQLVSHLDKVPKEARDDFAGMAKLVRDCRLAGESLPMCDDLPALMKVLAVLAVNSFHLLDDDLQPVGSGLFLHASALNHSCSPNAVVVFDGPNLFVRTLRSLAPGEEVTISYVEVAASTDARQSQLKTRYHFDCDCQLCCDVERDAAVGLLANNANVGDPAVRQRLSATVMAVAEGDRLRQAGEHQAAAVQYATALTRGQGLLGARHLLTHRAEDGMAHCSVMLQDFEGAFEHCGRTLEGYRFLYGKNHPMVALQYAMHGKLAWFMEDAAMAKKSLDVAVEILHITHGTAHPVTCSIEQLQREVDHHLSRR